MKLPVPAMPGGVPDATFGECTMELDDMAAEAE
jgi:hypothetical protein